LHSPGRRSGRKVEPLCDWLRQFAPLIAAVQRRIAGIAIDASGFCPMMVPMQFTATLPSGLRRFGRAVVDAALPPRCLVCGAICMSELVLYPARVTVA
jgi:hypothetical protein